MPLSPEEVDIEERKLAGRTAAKASGSKTRKEFGQTSELNYPYTYWWLVGYNEAADERP